MTEETIDQIITKLSAIRPTDNPIKYAKAQLQLGLIFQFNKKEINTAIGYYKNVLHQDSSTEYASAQLRLGIIFELDKNEIDTAIGYYQNVLRQDNSNADDYAKAQFRLGQIYEFDKKELDTAVSYYQNVLHKDSSTKYASAQLRLGVIFELNKKEFDTAIGYYQNVLRQDSSTKYASAQFRLGLIFERDKKEIDTAIGYYKNVPEQHSPDEYALAQLNLGWIYQSIRKENDTAIGFYQKVSPQNNDELYSFAQYQLGQVYLDSKRYDLAKIHYSNVSYVRDSFHLYAEAQINLCFLQQDTNKTLKFNKTAPVINNINRIYESCTQIRDQLLVCFDQTNEDEKTIAHYTKPQVLFSLLKQSSQFRLNLVDFMNDPSENKVLLNWLGINHSQINSDIKSFVSSFSFNHNSLNQFRLYGLEDNKPGSGVSLTFKSSFFCDDSGKSIDLKAINKSPQKLLNNNTLNEQQSDNPQTIFPLPLYRCLYFDPDTNYLALAKRNELSFYLEYQHEGVDSIEKRWKNYLKIVKESIKIKKIRKHLKVIKGEINQLRQSINENSWQNELKDIDQLIALATMPIASLIKHAAFKDEDECRIFYITDIASDKVHIADQFEQCKQIYLEYCNITKHISKVYLGPKCQPQHKLWLDNHSKSSKNNLNIRTIQSTMPLQ